MSEIFSEDQGTARSGCDDGFGVFGFLAFLLALLDLLLDLGGDNRSASTTFIIPPLQKMYTTECFPVINPNGLV